ncbi:MAG: D-alanine--D-alanine ligase [Cyclobacteriaceae bacterium]|nr:D-alanine--D-alanine ligase [Cyclobacteriaceae bacterium]
MSDKIKVGILYGGKSVEHKISIRSAKNIYQYIDRNLYEPLLFGIDISGKWFLCENIEEPISQGVPLSLMLDTTNPSFYYAGKTIKPDIFFPMLHGTNGEDGSVQGMLQMLEIPFVGSGIPGSSLSMSKLVSKQLFQHHNIPTARFLSFDKSQKSTISFQEVTARLGLPLIVKSANLGSSVGVNKVTDEATFHYAIGDAFKYDNSLLIEEFITGRELECAILGNENPLVTDPGEILIKKDYDFYSFDAKYVDGEAVDINIVAEMDVHEKEQAKKLSLMAYQALHCADFARVDLFLTKKGDIFVNEINTIPGFTNSSMFPMMCGQNGITFSGLITRLIKLAFERTKKTKDITTHFNTTLE